MAGWIYQGQSQVSPGGSLNMGNCIVINQIAMLYFPDFPARTRRYFGIGAWYGSSPTPQGPIGVEADQVAIWHNGTRLYLQNTGVGGNLQFYCQKDFGSLLTVRAWLYQP